MTLARSPASHLTGEGHALSSIYIYFCCTFAAVQSLSSFLIYYPAKPSAPHLLAAVQLALGARIQMPCGSPPPPVPNPHNPDISACTGFNSLFYFISYFPLYPYSPIPLSPYTYPPIPYNPIPLFPNTLYPMFPHGTHATPFPDSMQN
jgi:hypothetical protein